jgi:hypothetical protein
MAAESADGTGSRIGRVLRRETNCPDGHRQRLSHPLGFRERNVGELELRVLLGPGEDGVCQVIVEERDEEVYVRVLVHGRDEDDVPARRGHDYTDCPVRMWLDEPLGERAVIDVDDDEELPLYVPMHLNGVVQPDHGYRPANRRRRRPEALDGTDDVEPSSRRGHRLR